MKAKLIIEGKEFPIEILDPELEKLIKPKKKTGYEKTTKEDCTYYFDNGGGYVGINCDPYPETDGNNAYKAANYYTSKEVAENNVRADKLMRQLRRFSVEHRENKLDWSSEQKKYYFYFDHNDDDICIESYTAAQDFGTIYFDTEETTQLAIDAFHDELIWYFTEYKDSL